MHIGDSPRPIEKKDVLDRIDRSGVEAGVFVVSNLTLKALFHLFNKPLAKTSPHLE